MKLLRKLFSLATAASLLFAAGAAQADEFTPFDIKDGAGNTLASNVMRLDWSSNGTGLARGIGPFGTPLSVGQTFEFLYQATMVGKNGGTGTPSLGDRLDGESNGIATGDFEITIAAKMIEQVTFAAGPFAQFGLAGNNSTNKVAIYFDTARNANTATGQGFDDGIMVALLTIDSNTSIFGVTSPTSGQGSAKLTASIIEGIDFINPAYFEGVISLLFGIDFESSLNYPAGSAIWAIPSAPYFLCWLAAAATSCLKLTAIAASPPQCRNRAPCCCWALGCSDWPACAATRGALHHTESTCGFPLLMKTARAIPGRFRM